MVYFHLRFHSRHIHLQLRNRASIYHLYKMIVLASHPLSDRLGGRHRARFQDLWQDAFPPERRRGSMYRSGLFRSSERPLSYRRGGDAQDSARQDHG
jgi:hypothetical protein